MLGFLRKSTTFSLNALGGMVGYFGWQTASGSVVNEHTAIDVTAVFCAARVIAEGIGQMPGRIISEAYDRETGLPVGKIARDHWAHKLLAVKPNGWQTAYEFREGMAFNAAIGKGAIAIKNVVRGEVRELLPVPAGCWSVEDVPGEWTFRIRVDFSDKTHGYFDPSQVFYLRGPSMDGVKAIPAIQAAREAIGLSQALEKQQAKLSGNGGKPSGVLSFAQSLTPEARKRFEETWRAKYGQGGEGGIAVLDGDAKFASFTMTSVDAQYIETRRMQIEEIGRAFRVLPIMLMQADNQTSYASVEQMFRMHVIHTLGPWIERYEQAVNRDILSNAPGLKFDLDERNLMRGDFKDQAEYYTKALGAGGQPAWMTVNEIRAEVGLNPISEAWANTVSRGAMGVPDGNQAPPP